MNYPPSEWERIMHIQDVFTKAYHKHFTWREAAEILKVDERTVRRWKQTVEDNGYRDLLDQRTRRPSPKRAPGVIQNQVLKLYRDTYKDWSVKHFHEQLAKYGIGYKYTGMMLHIDGSEHAWIPALEGQAQDLILVLDDANNDVYYAKLVPEENTRECMLALLHTVKTKGVFCSLYSDRAGHFFRTPPGGQKVDLDNLTQIGRALYELGVESIPAYSPEARGRSERVFGTWQGRLPNELKLHGIKTIPDANRYILEVFLPCYRRAFLKAAPQEGSAFNPYRGRDLNLVFSVKEHRTVGADNTVHWNNRILQIEPSKFRISFAKCKVMVHEHLDGAITVVYGPHAIGRFPPNPTVSSKRKTKKQHF
jgi:transposase